jgi:hypothetical protein
VIDRPAVIAIVMRAPANRACRDRAPRRRSAPCRPC